MTASATESIAISADDMRIARFSALACNVHMLEASLPSPVPGVKPGLTNIITLILLHRHGWSAAAWTAVVRLFGGHLALGTLLSPTFLMALAGSASSLGCLGLLHRRRRVFSKIGLSAAAATSHICAQFVVVWLCFLPQQGLLYLLPPAMSFALTFGVINGIFSEIFTERPR